MNFFFPTPLKVLSGLFIYLLLLGTFTLISLQTLSNSNNVLGAKVQPDLTTSQTAGTSANINANSQAPDFSNIILLAFSPYSSSYYPEIVSTAKLIMPSILALVSFVFACMIANMMNQNNHMMNHHKSHRGRPRR